MTCPIMQSLPAGAARRVVYRALHRRRCAFAGLVVLLLGGSSAEGESATRVVTGEVAVAWEFERDGDAEGWLLGAHLSDLRVADGTLRAIVRGDQARFIPPAIAPFAAADFGTIILRARAFRSSTILLSWESDASPLGFFTFDIVGDGRFHEYEIPVHTGPGWQGGIEGLKHITFMSSLAGSAIELDYIRVLRFGPRLGVEKLRALRIVPRAEERIPIRLIVTNSGDHVGKGEARVRLPSGITLIEGEEIARLGPIEVATVDTLSWTVVADRAGRFDIGVETLVAGAISAATVLQLDVVEERWEQEEFLLSAWSPPAAWSEEGTNSLSYYGAANFETVLWVPPVASLVDNIALAGMKCLVDVRTIVQDWDLYLRAHNNQPPPPLEAEHFAELDEIIDTFLGNPTVIGYKIIDEPNHHAFENLRRVVAHIRRRDPTRLCFVNQHPSSAGTAWFGPRNYRELLEHHLETIQLELLSYDRYTFFRNGDGPDFFQDLAIVRRVALDYGVPFANIVQAVGDEFDKGLNWRIPHEAEHRWLAYNSLAYGARALVWFHWNHSWGLTASAERDRLFDSIRDTNAEINALAPYMMTLRSVGAYHVGEIPRGAAQLPDTAYVQVIEPPADMVVGLLADDADNDFFMIVNDYEKAVSARIEIDRVIEQLLTLDVRSQRVVPVEYGETAAGAEFTAELRPGAGRLYFFMPHPTHVASYQETRPDRSALRQNYPNPFNPETVITYDLADPGPVRLTVYDALGQRVEVVVDGVQPVGRHMVRWSGEGVASGVYFYVLEAGGKTLRRKMALLK